MITDLTCDEPSASKMRSTMIGVRVNNPEQGFDSCEYALKKFADSLLLSFFNCYMHVGMRHASRCFLAIYSAVSAQKLIKWMCTLLSLSLSLFVQTCSQMNFTQTQHTHTHLLRTVLSSFDVECICRAKNTPLISEVRRIGEVHHQKYQPWCP